MIHFDQSRYELPISQPSTFEQIVTRQHVEADFFSTSNTFKGIELCLNATLQERWTPVLNLHFDSSSSTSHSSLVVSESSRNEQLAVLFRGMMEILSDF